MEPNPGKFSELFEVIKDYAGGITTTRTRPCR